MYKVTKFPHGTFSWADCASTDAKAATRFYEGLMGWGKDEMPMGDGEVYVMFKVGEDTVGGMGSMPKEMREMNIPSHWNSYITVDDVDALVDKVTELGGEVIAPPFDVFDAGRMMTIQDPTGANVNLWQAKNHIGSGVVNTTGAMIWNELLTRDSEKAQAFFKGLLEWEFQKDVHQKGYTFILNKGRMNGGILQMDDSMQNPPGWVVYYNVADINAALEKVKANGGTVHIGKTEAKGVGHFAYISDPSGAVISILQADEPQSWEEN